MGKLVHLDKRNRVISAHQSEKPEGQVLIFTGVRYERAIDGGKNSPSPSPKNKRRRG